MTKDVFIAFRASADLKKSLEAIARSKRWSLSAAIVNILTDYVERAGLPESEPERRIDDRKDVNVPVMVSAQGREGRSQVGMITNVSKGGLRITLPKESNVEMRQDDQEIHLDLVLNLPGEAKPAQISVKPTRLQETEGEVEVGGTITNHDSEGYRKLLGLLEENEK